MRAKLEQMCDEPGADELMIQGIITDPFVRRHSHTLLAEMFELAPRRQT